MIYLPQKGSAIVLILVAIGLFGALSFAFTSSNRTSTSILTNEEVSTYANQIITYGNDVKAAVKRLQLRGCSDTEVSFENSVVAGYTNSNAPASKKCHVFDANGGGIQFQEAIGWGLTEDNSALAVGGYGPLYVGRTTITDIGTTCSDSTCAELTLFLWLDSLMICEKINSILGHDHLINPLLETTHAWSGPQFDGTYTAAVPTSNADLQGLRTACYDYGGGNDQMIFYHVLIAR